MFGFGDSHYKEEARVTVETCISCARQMDGLFLIDTPELQKIGETVPGFQTEMRVKLLASAQLTHNLMVIMMLVRIGAGKTTMKEFQKTAIYVDQYVNAHPFFGKRLSDLMIELTNQIYSPENQRIFPRYGWGRWVINLSKREKTGHPSDLNEFLTFDETKLADKIDYQITLALMAGCEPIYSTCVKPASLPVKGTAEAQYRMGLCYSNGEGVQQDYAKAVEWFRKAADQNYAAAQADLGACYGNGNGVTKDDTEAVKWVRKAADQGDAIGQYSLGNCYFYGRGVTRNLVEAYKWFNLASVQGIAEATTGRVALTVLMTPSQIAESECKLGHCYTNGKGVPQDYYEAVKWYRKAADRGNVEAQLNLGCCYCYGRGIAQDYVEAVKWYLKSAEQNYAIAQCNLGDCYEKGKGVPQDYYKAVKWYRKAAEQNLAVAHCSLGDCYTNGWGVAKDFIEAYKWFHLASEQGYSDATTERDALAALMTPDQIAEAQRLAREFKPNPLKT